MKEKSLVFTYGVIFVVMIIWGLNIVLLKLLVDAFPPATMTSFRIMLAGVVAIAIVLFSKQLRKMTKKEWQLTLLATIFGVVGHHFFLSQGLTLTNASNTVLILALLPLTTFLFAVIFLGDRLTKWRFFGIIMAFIGVMFIQGPGGNWAVQTGELYVFIAMVMQAISFIYIKKATATLDSKQMTSFMLLFGSIGLLGLSLIMEPAGMSGLVGAPFYLYVLFFLSAVVATALGHFLFNAAIQQIGAGQTALFNNFVPFFGLVSSAIFLGEKIYWYQTFGFLFIVLGVLFGTGYIERIWAKHHSLPKKAVKHI
ncbi:DMT family transporter [Alkalihalobacillus oceani]|uniref:DMT family transporter n=1 Tax=Halalkalibacter oceani TaxID=1653776 RepID=UPI00203A7C7F|nr:DMT family transporter [Halalkalibacter oceani]MCM3761304.1 DMT family transporter [Halalkalibacter oceani]